jgi:hypothetical protein
MVLIKLPEGVAFCRSFAVGVWILKFWGNKNEMILCLAYELDRLTEIKEVLAPVFVMDK